MNCFNTYQFLIDLKKYCDYNGITLKDMSRAEIKHHIKIMLKQIAHGSHIKE